MKAAFFALLLIFALGVSGQTSIDLVTASFRYGTAPRETGEEGRTTETVGLLNLKAPVVLSKSYVWFNDLTYQVSYLGNYSDSVQLPDPVGLHGLILQTGMIREIDKSRSVFLLAMPRLMTDLENTSLQHFQLGGIGMFEKKYSDKLTMRYGFMYNQELFGPMLVPLVYLDWQIGQRWSINGLLPISAKINFQINERLIAGFSHFGLITSYQLGDPVFGGGYMERKSIDLTIFGRYRLYRNFHLEARAGYALGRSYTQFAEGDKMKLRVTILSIDDNRVAKNVEDIPGPIADIRLVYNFPID